MKNQMDTSEMGVTESASKTKPSVERMLQDELKGFGSFKKGPRTRMKRKGGESCSTSNGLNIGSPSSQISLAKPVQETIFPPSKSHHLASTQSESIEEVIKDEGAKFFVKRNKFEESTIEVNKWIIKNLVSRDRKSKIRSEFFFASLDQRSEQAVGEAACAIVAVVVAHWLHANPLVTPSQLEFDSLIIQGSSLWRSLCKNEKYLRLFPDKHFDLETVVSANLRPIKICSDNSFTGVFNPEKFEPLEGLMSFDEIWGEIERNMASACIGESRIYILSWNDHFFVLKADHDGYYIIDSLGERLFVGCKQAYILKFDESSVIYERKIVNNNPNYKLKAQKGNLKKETVVCRGNECCREYIKRFLVAIPVAELTEEKEKGRILDVALLHKRLQFDLHYILMNN